MTPQQKMAFVHSQTKLALDHLAHYDSGGGITASTTSGDVSSGDQQQAGVGGALVGAGVGAAAGSVIPGLGTVAGAALGTIVGGGPALAAALTAQNQYNAQLAPTTNLDYSGLINTAGGQALNQGVTSGAIGAEQNLSNQYAQLANGQGPNAAQGMLGQATGQNVANQAALQAGQRGSSGNVGLMARQIGQQGASTQQQAAGQAASLQSQQALNALGAEGQLQGSIASQGLGEQAQGATVLGTGSGALNAQNATLVNNYSQAQALNQATAAQNSESTNKTFSGLMGGVSSLLSKGGTVHIHNHNYDSGGTVSSSNPAPTPTPPPQSPPPSTPNYGVSSTNTINPQAADAFRAGFGGKADGGEINGYDLGGSITQGLQSNPNISSGNQPLPKVDPAAASSFGSALSGHAMGGQIHAYDDGGLQSTPNISSGKIHSYDDGGGVMGGGDASPVGGAAAGATAGTVQGQVPGQQAQGMSMQQIGQFIQGMKNSQQGQTPSQYGHVVKFLQFAEGGETKAVPAMVSPGEIYLTPDHVQQVLSSNANPLKIGHKYSGIAKIHGDSRKNDTIPATLEEGGIVIPRHVVNKMDAKAAELFVRRAHTKKGH
jgi:hypothetical protein